MSDTEMANLKSSAQVCDYCKSEHGSEAFSMNHVITEEHLQWYKAVTNEDDVELPLKLCDNSYSMLKSRYDNHIAKEEVNISPGKQVLLACGEVFLGYVLLVTFIILGALPIWAIESYSERSAVQEQFNTIPANYTMKWNYGASVYYTMVTMTTIGYGDMSPSTRGGRAYMEVLCLFGLGFTATLIGVISAAAIDNAKRLFFLLIFYTNKLFLKIGGKPPMPAYINIDNYEEHLKGAKRKLYRFFNSNAVQGFCLFVFIWVYIIIGGVIFTAVEGWHYQDAHWYCFITLTTIGYGDFSAKTPGGRALCCLFALGGIGLLAAFFGLVGTSIVAGVRQGVKKIKLSIANRNK